MASFNTTKASSFVHWDFQVTQQGFVTRWGHSGSLYYKQFLPGGIEVPDRYPVKVVDPKQYALAQAIAKKSPA